MITANQWLIWASYLATDKQSDWLKAMQAEATFIDNDQEQARFAFGCFITVLRAVICSKQGIGYIARLLAILFITVMSLFGMVTGIKMGLVTETLPVSKAIITLCVVYLIGATLLLMSLRYSKHYAKLGIIFGLIGAYYAVVTGSPIEGISEDFFAALALEFTVFMLILHAFSQGLIVLNTRDRLWS